jgi:hypothetical protein
MMQLNVIKASGVNHPSQPANFRMLARFSSIIATFKVAICGLEAWAAH